ncbi:uncharacterized protein LOC125011736 [Mugil cephalus]|uniref:uncharacterized protein LOC125011736 n=1 Tax=Mugil cephalus TaxID=48193 RepID=UPI001FB6BCA7|nr:uncharacterized protein LOC125011736 [Mugil cephalus]
MSVSEKQILQRLAVLVVCHGLAAGQINSHYFPVQRPMSWIAGREFCQNHYVDFAVLSSEEQYFTLLKAMPTNKVNFWLGLKYQNTSDDWKWVDGAELGYQRWNRKNQEGCCATLKTKMEKDEKLLARPCTELHMIVCQGPVSPLSVSVDSVGTDHVNLSWNVSAFMQMTQHGYNVTVNGRAHEMLRYSGSAFMNISISNLTSATEHNIEVSAFVVRPDNVTGEKRILQSDPTTLQVTTEGVLAAPYEPNSIITIFLKTLKLVSLVPPLLVLYHIMKKAMSPYLYPDDSKDSDLKVSSLKLIVEETVVEVIPTRTRGFG